MPNANFSLKKENAHLLFYQKKELNSKTIEKEFLSTFSLKNTDPIYLKS